LISAVTATNSASARSIVGMALAWRMIHPRPDRGSPLTGHVEATDAGLGVARTSIRGG
jgi:hypothetical protein